jgi:hypothetical protein
MPEIRNCEFRFKCLNQWDSLDLTGDDTVRFCGQCNRTVHYCKKPLQLHAAIIANQCVAVEIQDAFGSNKELMVGEPLGSSYDLDKE